MKKITASLLITTMIILLALASGTVRADEIIEAVAPATPKVANDKARFTADKSFWSREKITYQGNVKYKHLTLSIDAEELVRNYNERKKITVSGNPVKVHYIDANGDKTTIYAPKIHYWEDSGNIKATGKIEIKQQTRKEKLYLSGNLLTAQRQANKNINFQLSGKPTQFKIIQPNQPPIEAVSDKLVSEGKGQITRLLGNVKLSQGDSFMAAAAMTYDGAKQTVAAEKGVDGSQRVETEFLWDEDDTQK